jgi:hypothetical protein
MAAWLIELVPRCIVARGSEISQMRAVPSSEKVTACVPSRLSADRRIFRV